MAKDKIPKALREQVWIKQFGKQFEVKCPISWCQNRIDVFNFESGHNIPESKKGKTNLDNLIPICGRCNKSMSNNYTIDEWNNLNGKLDVKQSKKNKNKKRYFCCGLFG